MSVLLKPRWPKSHQILTLAFAAAVTKAISGVAGICPLLKWPNDVMIHSRKVAGILGEARYDGSKLNHLIVGLGVNVNVKPSLFPRKLRRNATSLSQQLGREIDRNLVAQRIIEEMDRAYQMFESGLTSELLEEIKLICSTIGRKVKVTTVEGTFEGSAESIGDDGQILVRLRNGTIVSLYAADIVHLR